jgi:hypothetical protein
VSDGWTGRVALNIFALHGPGLTMAQWTAVFGQLCTLAKTAGMGRIIAMTPHETVRKLASGLGFKTTNLLVKELD